MHRTDKAPITIWHFRAPRSKSSCLVSASMTVSTFGLAYSASPYVSKNKKNTDCNKHIRTKKKENDKSQKIKKNSELCIVDKRASRSQQKILTGGREAKKEETVVQEEIVAWQPVTLCDDTLPTVLGTVNKCVCKMLWRMFCIKETKRQCVVQWQEAQLAK